jgi:hypothetical protein
VDSELPWSATDCVTVVGGGKKIDKGLGGAAQQGLGLPNPNPFNPVTRIPYALNSTQHVTIAVYDVAGRLVETLVNGRVGCRLAAEWCLLLPYADGKPDRRTTGDAAQVAK